MADEVYTRSVKNMREAGINPILAYSHGLSGAGSGTVSSGQSASVGSSPSGSMAQSFMGQSFADQNSASSQWSKGQSSGSSWNNSESGLATGLQQMGALIGAGLNALSSAKLFEINLGGSSDVVKDIANDVKQGVTDKVNDFKNDAKLNIETEKSRRQERRNRAKSKIQYIKQNHKMPVTSNGSGHKF